MTLLLRMGGVPARVATGFTPGGFRKRIGEWIVRDTDAHSWVEVWFDGLGWVTVDPTPPATPARSQVALIEPTTLPPEIEAVAGETAADPEARRPEGPVREPIGGGQTVDTRDTGGGPPWALIVAGILAAAAATLAVRYARRSRMPRSDEALERAIEELERALRRAGRPAGTGVTLRQLETRFGGAAYLQALRAARYAAGPPPDARARREFRRELAAGLGWRGRLRALWALPPRLR
jgi:hypothetical protein